LPRGVFSCFRPIAEQSIHHFPFLARRTFLNSSAFGMAVGPAGIEKPNTGHHHLVIDTTLTPEELRQPIPADGHRLHFGAGQTEAKVTLPTGMHALQLVLGTGRTFRMCQP
jgi:hypothetical protein